MSLTPSYTSSFITRPTSPALSTHSQDTATFVTENHPLSTDLSSTLAGRVDGPDRDTLTVNWSVANTNSDSGSMEERDAKGGGSGGGGGHGGGGHGGGRSSGGRSSGGGKSGRRGSREKTDFGKAFKNQFNTEAVKSQFQILRSARATVGTARERNAYASCSAIFFMTFHLDSPSCKFNNYATVLPRQQRIIGHILITSYYDGPSL